MSLAPMALALAVCAQAGPQHFPPGLNAVRILDGSARLVLDGRPPDTGATLLPPGVYFTDVGYAALTDATARLQTDVQALRIRAEACTPVTIQPPPPVTIATSSGWSTGAVVVTTALGVLVGGFVGCRVAGGCQ